MKTKKNNTNSENFKNKLKEVGGECFEMGAKMKGKHWLKYCVQNNKSESQNGVEYLPL